ncbi:alpha/beta hydrolase family protein [Brevibacillus sp. 179-C 1.1 NHS]|uniref:alpha/beta hydrolase family protein n=1 Tax=Brevibacillus sp. 179-C 1.1 NHS TaxID=3235177 RepID=UPI0039A00C64
MRSLEIVLAIVNSALLMILFSKAGRRKKTVASLFILSLTASLLQLILEGYRWQMLPLYSIPFILFVVFLRLSLSDRQENSSLPFKWSIRRRFIIMMTAVLYILVSIVLPVVFPVFSWRQPEGPYPIGTVSYHWEYRGKSNVYGHQEGSPRELAVQIWYPAASESTGERSLYIQHPQVFMDTARQTYGMPDFPFRSMTTAKTNAIIDADLSGEPSRFPLLLFSHGLGSSGSLHTEQIEQLVSQGYIIASIEHTGYALYSVSSDGSKTRFVEDESFTAYEDEIMNEIWLEDAKFVLNQLEQMAQNDPQKRFTGRIDLDKIGYFGHSFGGALAVQMLQSDSRIKAALNMDGTFAGKLIGSDGFQKPFMWMVTAEPEPVGISDFPDEQLAEMGLNKEKAKKLEEEWKRRHAQAAARGNYKAIFTYADHMSFSDIYYVSPLTEWFLGVNMDETHKTMNDLSLLFFDTYVRGTSSNGLDKVVGSHPSFLLYRGD